MADLDQLAAGLRQQAEEFARKASKLQEAASILDGLPGGEPLPQPEQVDTPTGDYIQELKERLEKADADATVLKRRVPGLEARIKEQSTLMEAKERHIAALEGRLRETDEGQTGRIVTLQTECRKLRDTIDKLRSEEYSLEEDLKAQRGHVEELEALLESATKPDGRKALPEDLVQNEPLTTVLLRNTGAKGRAQYVVTLPVTVDVLRRYSERYVGRQFTVSFLRSGLFLNPITPEEEKPPDEAQATEPEQAAPDVPIPEPDDSLLLDIPISRKTPVKVTNEQFRDWLPTTKGGEFTRQDVCVAFGISDPTAKKLIDWSVDQGLAVMVRDATNPGKGGRLPAAWKYVRPDGPGKAAEIDQKQRKEERAADILTEDFRPKRGKPIQGSGKQFKGAGNPDVRALIQSAQQAGATVSPTDGGHLAVVWNNEGQRRRVLIANTPRSSRTVANDRSRLRKAGLDI